MRFRKLRIAWSVAWGILCLLLIVLWVRSNWWVEQAFIPAGQSAFFCVGSMPNAFGVGLTDVSPNGSFTKISMATDDWLAISTEAGISWSGVMAFSITRDGVMMPCWCGVLLVVIVGATPWLRCRFSLLTLLIATTLLAVLLGAIVYAVR
jgi:hypothetical protein